MKNWKHVILWLSLLAMVFGLCACKNKASTNQTQPAGTISTSDETTPTQEQPDTPDSPIAPKFEEVVGRYACTGFSTVSAEAYGAPRDGCCLYLFDDGSGFLAYDEDTEWSLQWQINGNDFTATAETDETAQMKGTWQNGILEVVFCEDAYFRFQIKTQEQAAQEELFSIRLFLKQCEYALGVAYLGWYEEGTDLKSRIEQNCPNLLEYEPYISTIPQERIIGSSGELYCIVPADAKATVTVNLMQDTADGTEAVREVLYQSEKGEPVLLLCNAGGFCPDTQVVITGRDGSSVTWYPQIGEFGTIVLPADDEDESQTYDISDYEEMYPYGYNLWLSYGWVKAKTEDLVHTCWDYSYSDWLESDPVEYRWTLMLDADGTGRINMVKGESDDFTEVYSGTWSLNEGDKALTYLTLDMTRTGGTAYRDGEAPITITGTYVILESAEADGVIIGACYDQQELFVLADSENISYWAAAVG